MLANVTNHEWCWIQESESETEIWWKLLHLIFPGILNFFFQSSSYTKKVRQILGSFSLYQIITYSLWLVVIILLCEIFEKWNYRSDASQVSNSFNRPTEAIQKLNKNKNEISFIWIECFFSHRKYVLLPAHMVENV